MAEQIGLPFEAGARTPAPARKVRGGRARPPPSPAPDPEEVRELVLALACAEDSDVRDVARLAEVTQATVRELLEDARARKAEIQRAIAIHREISRLPAGPLKVRVLSRPPRR